MRSSLSKAELVNHPVRLGIVDALAGKQLTPKQLGEALPDVAQATLYRHLNALLEGEIIEVVGQRQAHGVTECTYSLKFGAAHFTREEFAAISPDDHKGFLALVSGRAEKALAGYVDQPTYDTTEEGMTYFAARLHVTDEEARNLRLDLLKVVEKYSKHSSEGTRPHLLTISSIPGVRS